MFEDPLFWVFVLPGLLLGLYAQSRIKLNVTKYSQVETKDGITGAEVARRLLDAQGLQDVAIEFTPGILSDHYDPRAKTLRLSQEIYFAPSVAAAGIAAHEAGMPCKMLKTTSPWRHAPTSCLSCKFQSLLGCEFCAQPGHVACPLMAVNRGGSRYPLLALSRHFCRR